MSEDEDIQDNQGAQNEDGTDTGEDAAESVPIGTTHPAHKLPRPHPEPEPYEGYPSNNEALRKILLPRNYHDTSMTLRHDLQVMLRDHPEAFDCLIYPALESEENEFVTVDGPRVGIADRDERAQSYGEPIQARAFMVPDQSLEFEAVDSALFESITGTQPPVNILLSVPGIRTYSLIQWLEYLKPDECETIERTYYVSEVKPLGRTLNAEMICVCYPLPALGETPLLWHPEDEEEGEDGEGVDGPEDDTQTPDTGEDAGDTDEDGTGDADTGDAENGESEGNEDNDDTASGLDGIKIGEI